MTWVGGPRDGETFAMQSYRPVWRVPIADAMPNVWEGNLPTEEDMLIQVRECPVTLTKKGYRVYWHKEMAQ